MKEIRKKSILLLLHCFLLSSPLLTVKAAEWVVDFPPMTMQTYRFPGGICYSRREPSLPDVTVYMVSNIDLITIERLRGCVAILKVTNWEESKAGNSLSAKSLRQARTENIICTVIDFSEWQILYKVQFSDLTLIKGAEELVTCISDAVTSKNEIIQSLEVPRPHMLPLDREDPRGNL